MNNECEPYFVMEHLEKGNLYRALRAEKLSWKQKVRIAFEVSDALNYIHSQADPILHGDLKSLNILLDANFRPKLCDFGNAMRLSESRTENMTGTVNWMAPELLLNGPCYNQKAEIYSFGMILYELLTERIPFEGCGRLEALGKICEGEEPVVPMVAAALGVEHDLVMLMKECIQREPEQRPELLDIVCRLKAILKSCK